MERKNNDRMGQDSAGKQQNLTGQGEFQRDRQGEYQGGDVGELQGEFQADSGQSRQSADNPQDDATLLDQAEELQQSAQREGMGRHRQSNRGNLQNLNGTIDIDDLGSQGTSAGKSR